MLGLNYLVFAMSANPALVGPANNTWNNSNNNTQTFTFNFTDPQNNTAACALYMNLTGGWPAVWSGIAQNNTNKNAQSNISFGADGPKPWYVNCTNGTTTQSAINILNIDTTGPAVTSIQSNATYVKTGASIKINATISDAGQGVNNNSVFLKNETGSQFQMANASATFFEMTKIVEYAAEGVHNYTINASDLLGSVNATQYINITVDNTTPAVTQFSVNDTDLNVTQTTSLNFTVNISDALSPIASVVMNGTNMTPLGGGIYSGLNTTQGLGCPSDGTCVLLVTATDVAGNINNSASLTLNVDTTPPLVTAIIGKYGINLVTANATIFGTTDTMDFNISVNDGSGTGFTGSGCIVSIGGGTSVTQAVSAGWCNVTGISTANLGLGNYTVSITANDTVGNSQANTSFAIWRAGPISPGMTQWSYCDGTPCPVPAVNETNATDRFFADGNAIEVVANFTNGLSNTPYTNLTVTVDFSQAGGNSAASATYIGNGLYRATGIVNVTNMTNLQDMNPVNITFNANNGTATVPFATWSLVINMAYPSCPPASQIPPGGWPMAPGYNMSAPGPVFSLLQAVGCTTNQTLCANSDTYGPGTWNGTAWLVCAPNFGGATTNFTNLAKTGNFSNVPNFTIEIPGKMKLRFLQNVSFDTQQKAQAIMEFAMKNLMSAGRIGINESEWNGQGGKPNLNLSAEVTFYNITGLLGLPTNDFIIRVGSFNGSSAPNDKQNCPASKCSSIVFDGQNLTLQISSFSTYTVDSATYDLQFANLTAIAASVNQSVNATYRINITDFGNHTQPATYNLTLSGIGSLNVTQITLNSTQSGNPNAWVTVELNVSNATAGTYPTVIIARYSTNASMVWNSTADGIGSPFTTTVLDNSKPNVSGGASSPSPVNPGSNVTLNITVTDNVLVDKVLVNLSLIGGSSAVQMANITAGVYEVNATVAIGILNGTYNLAVTANDTSGNINNTATIPVTVANTAPSVTVIYPNSAVTVKGTVIVNATVTDNNGNATVTNVTFYYTTNGVAYTFIGAQNVSQANQVYNVSWNTAGLNMTNVTLYVNATDGTGSGNDGSNAVFIVDNAAPQVTGGIATPSTANPEATVKLNVTVGDINVSQVFVNLSLIGGGALTQMTRVSGNEVNGVYEYNATVPDQTLNGTYALAIIANDTVGNLNNTENISLVVNNTAPSVTVNYPNGGQILTGIVIINAMVVDANGNSTVTNVTFYYTTDGSTYTFIGSQNVSQIYVFYNVTWNTTGLNGGTFRIMANATDGLNTGSDQSNNNFSVDNTAPSVTVSVLPASPSATDDLTCNVTAIDNVNTTLMAYWKWYNASTEKFSGSAMVSNDTNTIITTLASGNTTKGETWNCSILISDGNNNATSWQNASVTITGSAPSAPSLTAPSNGSSTNDNTTVFSWAASTDADNDTITYGIEISTNSSFAYINQSNYTLAAANYTSSELNEGVYYWHAFAITSDANSSASANRTFTVDIAPPTGISISAPSSVYVGDTISASCSASDTFDTSVSCGCNSPSTSSVGTATVSCTATDDAGNSASGTASVTVQARSSGGGGGSGPKTPPKHSQSWTKVTPGAATIMKVVDKEIGLMEISVKVTNEANNVRITVTKLDGKPASVTHEVSGKVYQYIEIKKENINDAAIQSGTLKFKVEKSWLASNKFNKSSVTLNRYTTAWTPLMTRIVSEDSTTVYYDADTSGFSYFAISAQQELKQSAPSAPAAQEQQPAEEKKEVTEETTPGQGAPDDVVAQPPGEKPSRLKPILAILLVLALLSALVVALKRKEKQSEAAELNKMNLKSVPPKRAAR